MAFAVVCKSCQARFLLNDDLLRRKVAGRVVTVRCRQCHATIEVDASKVEARSRPENEAPPPPAAPTAPKLVTAKAVPSPPRPTRSSTLMGIGTPGLAVTGGAGELVALSPGLLNMAPAPPSPTPQPRGFPEPPPPPGAVEELSSSDWEITETPALAKAAPAAPTKVPDAPAKLAVMAESVDDFIEELPPSFPPPSEEPPSSSGTPSLSTLAHHEPQARKAPSDDFLSNMTAAMNGGIGADAAGAAPTIDVSALTAAPAAPEALPSIDISTFDAPLVGSKTMPLFALGPSATTPATNARPARGAAASAGATEASLGPSTWDRPKRESEPTESTRTRRNVIAPATKSVPPAAPSPRPSGLAAPVLLALAGAAAFLIWKRSASTPTELVALAEDPAAHVAEPARAASTLAPAAEPARPPPTPSAALAAPPADDDITFETTPSKTPVATPAAPHDKASAAGAEPRSKPASVPTDAKPEPAAPSANDAPKEPKPAATPSEPTEPSGPFDRAAAAAALTAGATQASACKKEGDPSGVASVVITFAPSGRVTSANISGPPFAGTATGGCIAAALRKARVPPFEGDRVTVSKTIVIQ